VGATQPSTAGACEVPAKPVSDEEMREMAEQVEGGEGSSALEDDAQRTIEDKESDK
jgi:hypothetical protein